MYITSGLCLKSNHEYENVDYASNYSERRRKRSIVMCGMYCTLIIAIAICLLMIQKGGFYVAQKHTMSHHKLIHITDPHIDIFFDPEQSVPRGGCHACDLSFSNSSSDKSSLITKEFRCPSEAQLAEEIALHAYAGNVGDSQDNYIFGRYGCDPPLLLWTSLLSALKQEDPSPAVIIFTGDIVAHSYPDDNFVVKEHTTIDNVCLTKFHATKIILQQLVSEFPTTRFAFSIGNVDHLPRDIFWRPYIKLLGDMMLDIGFFTRQQHEQFNIFGSNFIDVQGVRYVSIDMTLFTPSGEFLATDETSVVPKLLLWLDDTMEEAADLGLSIYFIGHQPLSTRFGQDELDVKSAHYHSLKSILAKHSSNIRVGLFGHNNVENLVQVLSPGPTPHSIFPAIVGTGVSPRAPNQPTYHVYHKSAESGTFLDFQQRSFDLMKENDNARNKLSNIKPGQFRAPFYPSATLTAWFTNKISWSTLSDGKDFTSETLHEFLGKVSRDSSLFYDKQLLKRGGYIGRTTPEIFVCEAEHDIAEDIVTCLFPKQEKMCWDPSYWIR